MTKYGGVLTMLLLALASLESWEAGEWGEGSGGGCEKRYSLHTPENIR